MKWIEKDPKIPGWYLVKTRTEMGKILRLDSYWNGENWHFRNQSFIAYLKNSLTKK